MTKKTLLFSVSLVSFAVIGTAFALSTINNSPFNVVRGDNPPFVLNLNRSITSDEVAAGKATFYTTNGNDIDFLFDSSKASVDSGLISLATDGYFCNDTAITGISQVEITLASGSATLCYGNSKDALCVGSRSLSGTSLITINLEAPSDYFKISDVSGPLAISSMKFTYSCSNAYDPEMTPTTYNSGTSYADFTMENWALSQKSVTFMFKKVTADATGSFKIRLCDSTKTALGYVVSVTLNASSATAGSPANVEYAGDGWYKFMLDPALLTKQSGRDGSETMKYLQIADVSTPIEVAMKKIESMFKPIVAVRYDLPTSIPNYTTSDAYLTFKVKKVNPAEAGVVQFKLSNGTTDSYGIRFTFVANDAPTVTGGSNRACVSVDDLGNGWYLITTQSGKQITGSAFDATKLLCDNYSGQKDFYLKDLTVHN